MKKRIYVVLLVFIISCDKEIKPTNNKIDKNKINASKEIKPKESSHEIKDFDFEKIKGFYVGDFEAVEYKERKKPSYSNKINISLDSLEESKHILYGHSVVAGNVRPFEGKYELQTDTNFLKVIANEPGNDKYDGSFQFECTYDINHIDSTILFSIVGTWKSFNDNLSVTERKYDLEYKKYKYNPNQLIQYKEEYGNLLYNEKTKSFYESEDELEGETISIDINKFNASNTRLTNKDIENFYQGDLEIIRNAIYARHGYSFKNRRMRYFFDRYINWYIPVTIDVRSKLTTLEKENIKLLKRYELHADKYYDYFGR